MLKGLQASSLTNFNKVRYYGFPNPMLRQHLRIGATSWNDEFKEYEIYIYKVLKLTFKIIFSQLFLCITFDDRF